MDIGTIAAISSLLGFSAKEIAKLYNEFLKKDAKRFSNDQLAGKYQAVNRILAKGLHTKLMIALYPDLSDVGLSRFAIRLKSGTDIATTIVGSPEYLKCEALLCTDNEDHILLEDPQPSPVADAKTTARILADAKARGLRLWDQSIYRLHDFNLVNNSIRATFSIDRFMKYRLGIGALLDEAYQALIDTEENIEKILDDRARYIPLREQFLPNSASMADFGSRMCAGGIHVTVAFQRPDPDDDFVIPIQKRSPAISEGQDMISVLPQAFHQPTVDPKKEINLEESFYRELYEELFGGEEAISGARRLRYDWYKYESPEIQWFAKNKKEYRLVLTGFGLNLISGNYEFSLLCIVRSTSFWKDFGHKIVTNWEAVDVSTPMVSTRDTERIERLIQRPQWTGTGLFSFTRGLEYLADLEPVKVKLPDMSSVCL